MQDRESNEFAQKMGKLINRRQAISGLAGVGASLITARTVLGGSSQNGADSSNSPLFAGTFDVKSYGAVGNGSTDDASAFERAISAAAAAGGGVVTVPAATFVIGSSIRMRSNVILRGVGYDSVIKLRNGASVNMIRSAATNSSNPVSKVGIEKLRLDGNKANQKDGGETYGISMIACNDSWVTGIWVENTVRSGIYLAGSRNKVTGCSVTGAGVSGVIGRSGIVFDSDGVNHPVNSLAQGNTVTNVREHGVKVYYQGTGTVFDSNTVKNNGDRGIYSMGCKDVVITNNTVTGSGTTGILVGGGNTGSPNNRVSGNVVTGCASHGILVWDSSGATVDKGNDVRNNKGNGIYVLNGPSGKILGNFVVNNGGTGGIVCVNAPNSNIAGNQCTGNANAGVYFWDQGTPSTNVSVTGNVCADGGARAQNYGVRSVDGTRSLTVTDNDLRGNLTSALSLAGSGNVTSGNLTTGSPGTPTQPLAVTLNPTSGPAATKVQVNGTGFGKGEKVNVYLDTSTSTALASATSTSAGAFTAQITIPQTAAGEHRIHAVGQTSKIRTAATFTVSGGSQPPTQPGSPVADSLISNASFEQGNTGWYIESGAGAVASNPHGGKNAMRLAKTGGFADQRRNVKAGTNYTVTAWGKMSATGDTGMVGVSYWDANGGRLTSAEPADLKFTSTSYSKKTLSFTVPAGVTAVAVWIWKNSGSAEFFADDLQLVSNGTAAAKSASETEQATQTPEPEKTAESTKTPKPTQEPTKAPEPTKTQEPTKTPEPTQEPTKAPEPTQTPEPTKTPAPTISSIKASTGGTKAKVAWRTDVPADSTVLYGVGGNLDQVINDASATKRHSITIENLERKTEYSFMVRSTGEGGQTESTVGTFTTR